LDILTRSGDISDQCWQLCKIAPNFVGFWPQIFLGVGPKILALLYKEAQSYTDHVLKFDGDQPRVLGDAVAK